MTAISLTRRQILTFATPGLILLISASLALSPLLDAYPDLAIGITYDLTITAPFVYFLFIRKQPISKITVVPFFVAGVVLATILLPADQQGQLDLIKTFVFPVVELVVLATIGTKVYRGIQTFKTNAGSSVDFYSILKKSTLETFDNPRVAAIFATEIASIYYALFSWKRRKTAVEEFTNYKESGSIALFGALLLVLAIETFVFHILLVNWSPVLAWILTISSVYFALQIFGHIKAMVQRHSMITDQQVVLKYGLFGDMTVHLRAIERVEKSGREVEEGSKKVESLSLLGGLEPHNVIIHFKNAQSIESVYGIKKNCDVLLLHIDNAEAFVADLTEAISQ